MAGWAIAVLIVGCLWALQVHVPVWVLVPVQVVIVVFWTGHLFREKRMRRRERRHEIAAGRLTPQTARSDPFDAEF